MVDSTFVAKEDSGRLEIDVTSTLTSNYTEWGWEATILLEGLVVVGPPLPLLKRRGGEKYVLGTSTLIVRGSPTVTLDSLVVIEGGVIGGSGTYPFGVVNGGTVSPGNSPGVTGELLVEGDYVQEAAGTLEIDISASNKSDKLVVGGLTQLSGTLRVSLRDGFHPRVGASFFVVRGRAVSGSVIGAFDEVDTEGFKVDVIYESGTVKLLVTSVLAVDEAAEIPTEFALHQNYPNPFNPVTAIPYDLPKPSSLRLSVFDLLGREVRVLASGSRPAGRHEARFDAGDLPSGLYFYRLEAGDFTETKSLVVLK